MSGLVMCRSTRATPLVGTFPDDPVIVYRVVLHGRITTSRVAVVAVFWE